jgi:hypothetical protein
VIWFGQTAKIVSESARKPQKGAPAAAAPGSLKLILSCEVEGFGR